MSPIILCGSLSRLASLLGRSMHEAGYRALGLPFTYVPFEVRDLRDAIAGMRGLGIRGFGVSHPFKQEVMPLLDALDPVAARIGAVNTIVNDDGRLVGHNTDWIGAVRALEEVRPVAGASVLLLGAGGAARAIAFGLAQKGAHTTIANRDTAKADHLASEVGAGTRSAPFAERERAADYDVVINATSLGQKDVGLASPVPARALHARQSARQSAGQIVQMGQIVQIVMDIVYKPVATELLAEARQAGAITVHGGRMLLYQAAAQFEVYTGEKAPLEAMEAAQREALGAPLASAPAP